LEEAKTNSRNGFRMKKGREDQNSTRYCRKTGGVETGMYSRIGFGEKGKTKSNREWKRKLDVGMKKTFTATDKRLEERGSSRKQKGRN